MFDQLTQGRGPNPAVGGGLVLPFEFSHNGNITRTN